MSKAFGVFLTGPSAIFLCPSYSVAIIDSWGTKALELLNGCIIYSRRIIMQALSYQDFNYPAQSYKRCVIMFVDIRFRSTTLFSAV